MNILLLTDDMLIGGVPRHVIDLANGLAGRGRGVILAATDGPMRQKLNRLVPFIPLELQTPTGRKRPIGTLKAFSDLRTVVNRERIDVIHSHKRYTDALSRLLARTSGIRHVSTCHNVFWNLKTLSPFGDLTIACSDKIAEMLVRDFRLDARLTRRIYVGIKPFREFSRNELVMKREVLGIHPTQSVILSVGQLTEDKNHQMIIEAAAILSQSDRLSNAFFCIVGDGPLEKKLKDLVKAKNLQGSFRFYPTSIDVEAMMNLAEFLILPSVREGLPYVLLEAASLGKPHIATDVGGVSEFVRSDETGLLIPPNNPTALSNAIIQLLADPTKVLHLGKLARERFDRHHHFDRFIDETVAVYHEVLGS